MGWVAAEAKQIWGSMSTKKCTLRFWHSHYESASKEERARLKTHQITWDDADEPKFHDKNTNSKCNITTFFYHLMCLALGAANETIQTDDEKNGIALSFIVPTISISETPSDIHNESKRLIRVIESLDESVIYKKDMYKTKNKCVVDFWAYYAFKKSKMETSATYDMKKKEVYCPLVILLGKEICYDAASIG